MYIYVIFENEDFNTKKYKNLIQNMRLITLNEIPLNYTYIYCIINLCFINFGQRLNVKSSALLKIASCVHQS